MTECVCFQWILRCKCRNINWKFVTVVVGRIYFDIADGVCACGQLLLKCKCRILNWKYVELGVDML